MHAFLPVKRTFFSLRVSVRVNLPVSKYLLYAMLMTRDSCVIRFSQSLRTKAFHRLSDFSTGLAARRARELKHCHSRKGIVWSAWVKSLEAIRTRKKCKENFWSEYPSNGLDRVPIIVDWVTAYIVRLLYLRSIFWAGRKRFKCLNKLAIGWAFHITIPPLKRWIRQTESKICVLHKLTRSKAKWHRSSEWVSPNELLSNYLVWYV